ncbi:hypothetical protein PRVXH_000942 [Proteinivorax hydrogeniformans]|uniref:ABC-2 type transport system permease protein n=1 Tax=Proteinivorax hydrogeniformans TaxID=1826727 RepID=A0AAU8HW65_9FIRM
MNNLTLLYKIQWKMFVNRFFRDKKQTAISGLAALAILAVVAAVIWFFRGRFFYDLGQGSYKEIQLALAIVFSITLMIMFAFQFFASLINLVSNFYKSPDINYLVSTPLPSGLVLMYKLINHTFKSIGKEAVFFFPLYIAIAISINATALFYIILPITYIIVAAIASSLGIIFGMIFLRKFSIRIYRYLVNIGNFIVIAAVWLLALNFITIPEPLGKIAEFILTRENIALIIPFISGAELLSNTALGLELTALKPLAYLLGVAAVLIVLTYYTAKHNFYAGWMNSTHVAEKKTTPMQKKHKKTATKNSHPILSLTKYEFIRASKNYDIMAGALLFYALYIGMMFYLNTSDMEFKLAAAIAMAAGMFFISTGTAVPFVSSEITKNPQTAKFQYSTMKFLPLKSKDILSARILMIFIPTLVVLTIGLTTLAISLDQTLTVILIANLLQLFILIGYVTLSQAYEVMYYQRFFENQKFIGGLISLLAPIVYQLLTIGLFILYQLKPLFPNLWLNPILNIPTLVAIATLTILCQLTYTYNLGKKAWDKMEF